MDAKKTILLVDGDQNFGNTMAKALDSKKYSYFYAATGHQGIQLALDHHPDLILCNLALDPIDGQDVLRAFKGTSSNGSAPVVFLCDKPYSEMNGHFTDLNEKNVIVKPEDSDDFIKSIESWIPNRRVAPLEMSDDFNTLFKLTPFGLFVFAGDHVLKANTFLWDMIGRDPESVHLKLDEIFERSSLLKIRHWVKHFSKDHPSVLNDQIILKDRLGEEHPMSIKLSQLKADGETTQFIGIVFPSMSEKNVIVNYHLAHEVCNMLKRENLAITEPLEKKITQIIKSRSVENNDQSKSFFTKREKEVLRLTMEGLSIKVIADKLSISSRTVEKYRTNLMEKSGARNIVEVIVFSLKNNLIKL